MPDAVGIVKRAAAEAVEAGKPVTLLFGEVEAVSPLRIRTGPKTVYTESMLVLTRNVCDYETDVTISTQAESETHTHPVSVDVTVTVEDTYTGGGSAAAQAHASAEASAHSHPIRGRKRVKVHNALAAGDLVVLARVQGGKRFVVLDRLKSQPGLTGEWL